VAERGRPIHKELGPSLGESSSPESLQVLAQQRPEKGFDCRKRGRAIVEHRPDVDEPQGVHRYSVTGLQTVPIAPAKDLRLGRPGKGSFMKGNCPRKGKEVAKFPPETLRQRTSPDEMTLRLHLARGGSAPQLSKYHTSRAAASAAGCIAAA